MFKKKFLFITIIAPLVLFFALFEIVLSSGIFDNLDNPRPVWISQKYRDADLAIDIKNYGYSRENPFGFTDVNREKKLPEGKKRIVVLSDSFIFGDGIPYEKTWSHVLEKKITEIDPSMEVASWGQCGWATINEFEFLKNEGALFDKNLVLIGWNSNDIEFRDNPYKDLSWQKTGGWLLIRKFFPNTMDFISSHINRFLEQYVLKNYGYANWHDQLYNDWNIERYGTLMAKIKEYSDKTGIPIIIVHTPANLAPITETYWKKMETLFKSLDLPTLDLHPVVHAKLRHLPPRSLWANPADGHPGELLNRAYAEEVLDYLKREKWTTAESVNKE